MTAGEVRSLREANPFRPFTIHLADGQTFHVPLRDFVSQSPTGRTIIVYGPDDLFNIVDLYLITSLKVQPAPAESGSPAGASGEG